MEKLLLRPEECAVLLGIGRTRVYELIRVDALRSVKVGKSRRVTPEALHDYVKSLEQDAA